MKKIWLTAGVGFGVGAAMFVVSGFSAMANTSGYDAYKTALYNMQAEASLTAAAQVSVTDNGAPLFTGRADVKLQHAPLAGSVAATLDDGTGQQTLNVFCQDGKLIFKSSADDVYRVTDHGANQWQHNGGKQGPPEAAQQVINALFGNMKELATVETEPDGSKQASLHVTGGQIPAVVNALGSLVVSQHGDGSGWHHGNGGGDQIGSAPFAPADLHINLPKLVDNVKVKAVNLDAKINPDNVLTGQTAEIDVSGTDGAGKQHAVAIKLHVDFSGFNQTVPDRVDLTGKQTVTIQNDKGPGRGWHHPG